MYKHFKTHQDMPTSYVGVVHVVDLYKLLGASVTIIMSQFLVPWKSSRSGTRIIIIYHVSMHMYVGYMMWEIMQFTGLEIVSRYKMQ